MKHQWSHQVRSCPTKTFQFSCGLRGLTWMLRQLRPSFLFGYLPHFALQSTPLHSDTHYIYAATTLMMRAPMFIQALLLALAALSGGFFELEPVPTLFFSQDREEYALCTLS
eukprot:375236-Pelagomonas_calceolata.AAC.2